CLLRHSLGFTLLPYTTLFRSGADFIGFVFAPSKRRVSIEGAAEIVSHLSEESKIVGVFVNESLDNMIRIAKAVQLDYIQLHGNEDRKSTRLNSSHVSISYAVF